MKRIYIIIAFVFFSAINYAAKYTLVTGTEDLKNGDKVIVACNKKGVVAGALSGTNMPSVTATFAADNSYLTTTEGYEYTIEGGGTGWVLKNADGFIGCTSAKNSLTTDAGASKYSSNWVIEEISYGDVKYLCKSNNYKNTYLQFNASAKYFSNYESKQTAIQFYKKTSTDDNIPTIECKELVDFGQVNIENGISKSEQQLDIEGINLSNDITLSLSFGADNFTISTTELSATGGIVTISFTADKPGSYEGKLLVNSGSVSVNVTLMATAVEVTSGGTREQPYTCGDIINMAINDAGTKAWVSGYILGSAAAGPIVAKTANNTSLLLADDMNGTHPIAVQLPSGDIRNNLNVVDNINNIGVRVKVYGSLMTYFNSPGVKNTSDYEFIDDIVVEPVKVTGVSLSETNLALEISETATLFATVSPIDAEDQSVTWSSSDKKVAIVSNEGVVTAIATGTANIIVTTTDGGFTATCVVTVREPEPPVNPDALETISSQSSAAIVRKVMREGVVYIETSDGRTFTATGGRCADR